jgi:hypothetical protein
MTTKQLREMREAIIVSSILMLAIQLLLVLKQPDTASLIRDPDGYSWLNRVMLLYNEGNWFDASNPRISPPDGLAQHWSRPYDLILYSGAWIGSGIYSFKDALYGWSLAIGPILQILSIITLFWAFRPVIKRTDYMVLGFLYVAQAGIVTTYSFGRPDHQQLLNLLFILSIGVTTRLLTRPFNWRLSLVAGIISAFGMWVSVETLLVVLGFFVCFGGLWLFGTEGLTKKILYYSSSLTIFAIVFALIEKGYRSLNTPELDKLSVVFISLFFAITLFWLAVHILEEKRKAELSPGIRFTMSLVGSVAIIALMEALFPGFFKGPAAGVDSLYNETRRLKILEVIPLVDFNKISKGIWEPEIVRFSYWMGLLIPALPVIMTRLVRTPYPDKMFWILLSTLLIIYIPYTFLHLRWIHYSVILLILPYAYLVSSILRKMDSLNPGILASISRIFVILFSASIFNLPGYLFPSESDTATNKMEEMAVRCQINRIASLLNSRPGMGDTQKKLIAFVDDGPEILYRTNHSVFSIPSHRHQPGYTISYRMMNSDTDEEALHYASEGKPDYILLCPSDMKLSFYSRHDERETFYQRLANRAYPLWLNEVKIPEDVDKDYRLLEVRIPN